MIWHQNNVVWDKTAIIFAEVNKLQRIPQEAYLFSSSIYDNGFF